MSFGPDSDDEKRYYNQEIHKMKRTNDEVKHVWRYRYYDSGKEFYGIVGDENYAIPSAVQLGTGIWTAPFGDEVFEGDIVEVCGFNTFKGEVRFYGGCFYILSENGSYWSAETWRDKGLSVIGRKSV